MDKNEFIKVVIAALVGAIAKEFLAMFIKRTAAAAVTLKAKADGWLIENPHRMMIVLDVAMLISFGTQLFLRGDHSKVTTRLEVIGIAFTSYVFMWVLINTVGDFKEMRRYSKLQKQALIPVSKVA